MRQRVSITPTFAVAIVQTFNPKCRTSACSKVIGYFAFSSPTEVICDGEACVIAGSERAMRDYLEFCSSGSAKRTTIKKTRLSDIIQVMKSGAPYAFDERSYNRFYPLANKCGFS